jgi:hypothetical protein
MKSMADGAWWYPGAFGRGEIVMRLSARNLVAKASAFAAALALGGCGVDADDEATRAAVDLAATVDPASYAGDVMFRIAETFPAEGREIPFEAYLGLAPETQTRLGGKAFVDLRHLQAAVPDLLTGTLEPSCGLGLDLRFEGVEADGDTIRAQASTDARVYRCRQRGTEEERRGMRFLTQTIDIEATLSARLDGECIVFRLDDLSLDPKGLLGGLATLFRVTERARAAILEKARTTLTENPVCPDLPPAIALLDPRFPEASLREIGNGGIGAALSGSVDLSAVRIVELLALVDQGGTQPAALTAVTVTGPGRAAFHLDDSMTLRGTEVGIAVDVRLMATDGNRIGIETILDLRDLQAQLPKVVAGEVLVDTCGGKITMQSLGAEVQDTNLIARGTVAVESFDCERTGPGSWQRGALLTAEDVGVRAELSADLVEGCAVFRLIDLQRDPPGAFRQLATGSGRLEAARALLLDAVRLVLEDRPLCPDLTPEIDVLSPQFDHAGPVKLAERGVGVALEGSIEASPRTLVALLSLFQARGALPPQP